MAKFCSNCGNELREENKFCDKCGARVLAQPEVNKTSADPKDADELNKIQDLSTHTKEKDEFHSTQEDLYKKGMDIIISSSVLYSTPFMMAGKQILDQFEKLKNKTAENLSSDLIKNIPLEDFLSDFYKYANLFVERVSQYFSDIIRKSTQRKDIKAKTTESIADEIRKESFKKFDEVLSKYTVTMQELGVQIESVSSIKSAVQGTFMGGGLQLMGSRGKSSGTGMIAGALIGAAMAEQEKMQLRENLLKTTFDGIKETIVTLPVCNQKLMDQYCSYIFGENIDFTKRDQQIERGKQILSNIKNDCATIMDNIVSGNAFWDNAIIRISKAQKGVMIGKFYAWGCFVNFILLLLIGWIFHELDFAFMEEKVSNKALLITFIILLSLPLLYYFFYNIILKKNRTFKQKGKILEEIKAQKAEFGQLENSVNSIMDYKDKLNIEFNT